MKNFSVLVAADYQNSKNYVSILQHAGFETLNLRKDNSAPYPSMSSLLDLPYEILLLPGGGDFSSDLFTYKKASLCPSTKHNNKNHVAKPSQISPEEAALDMMQYALLTSALQAHKPVVGICKGMQLINVFFGGTLIEDLPDNAHRIDTSGQTPVDRIHKIHTISPDIFYAQFHESPSYALQNDIFQILTSFSQVNSAHHQGIRTLGKDLTALQYAGDNLPETILHKVQPVIGFQWHPERFSAMTAETMREILLALLRFQI